MAILDLPKVISPSVQNEIPCSGLSVEERAQIFLDAIRQIGNGSAEKVKTLITRMLLRTVG